MKKIGKFRAWLIKKLGGEIPSLCKPVIIEKKLSTITLSSRIELTQKELQFCLSAFPRTYERRIKKDLWIKLGDEAIPLICFSSQEDKDLNTMVYKAKITIVNEQK